jgi:predicted dehydrogenase
MQGRVRVGIVGSGFISSIHAEALQRCAAAETFAVASPTNDHSQRFAEGHHIPHSFTDYRKMLEMDEIDMIVGTAPSPSMRRGRASMSCARNRSA